jgi:molybdate transport system substrate-binding protein
MSKRRFRGLLLAVFALAALPALAEPPTRSPAGRVAAEEAVFPPWQNGTNNDAPNKGLVFTVPPVDTMVDFHGSVTDTALVIYASGNNFFAYKQLVDLFGDKHPEWRGRIFYETLPPGLLLKQLRNGGTVTSGNLTFTAKPDIMMAEKTASENWVKQNFLVDPVVSFATNDLTIMVRAGNPDRIRGLADLGKPRIVLAMPNPAFEGVAGQIKAALRKAGGDALANAVYERKVDEGTTILTRIHHRQTPLWLMQDRVRAGVTWRSEALFQEQAGHPIAHVDIPPEQNVIATYSAAMAANAPHPYVAKAWLDFIKSDEAFAVLQPYGFKRYAP